MEAEWNNSQSDDTSEPGKLPLRDRVAEVMIPFQFSPFLYCHKEEHQLHWISEGSCDHKKRKRLSEYVMWQCRGKGVS